jgi:hypothetical protein
MAYSSSVFHWRIEQFKNWIERDDLPPEEWVRYENTLQEIEKANYPKPDDCFETMCLKHRPTCLLGICRVAILLCDPEELQEEQSNIGTELDTEIQKEG